MIQTEILLILVVFASYFLKAMTAIGSAMILVPLGALLIGSINVVVLESILDMASSLVIWHIDRKEPSVGSWSHLAGAVIVGTALGSLILSRFSVERFNLLLGILVVLLAVWFMAGRPGVPESIREGRLGGRKSREIIVCTIAGLLGGITGVSGPPLILYFGSSLAKGPFRIVMTRLFLVQSVVRIVIYGATGLINTGFLPWLFASTPVLLFSVYVGNKVFVRLSDTWFPRVVGMILLVAGLKLFF